MRRPPGLCLKLGAARAARSTVKFTIIYFFAILPLMFYKYRQGGGIVAEPDGQERGTTIVLTFEWAVHTPQTVL